MSWSYTPEAYKAYTKETWDASAEAYGPLTDELGRYDPPLFRLAAPSPGEAVLDVGTGPGEPALTLARVVAPGGQVTGIDLAGKMIDVAGRRAKAAGLTNVDLRVMDAEDLAFDDGTFGLVVNRFSLQLFTDPELAVAEAWRVLEPGGRFVASVWGSPGDRVPHIHVIIGPMLDQAEPDETGYLPTPYELGEEGELATTLEGAGFEGIVVERHTFSYLFESPDAFLGTLLEGTPVGHSLAEEDPSVQEDILARARENLEAYTFGGAVVIPGQAVYVRGVKPGPET